MEKTNQDGLVSRPRLLLMTKITKLKTANHRCAKFLVFQEKIDDRMLALEMLNNDRNTVKVNQER